MKAGNKENLKGRERNFKSDFYSFDYIVISDKKKEKGGDIGEGGI